MAKPYKEVAVANGVPVVSVNRVGFEQDGESRNLGGSFTNAKNYCISHLNDQEEVVVTELDLSQTDYFRKHWPFERQKNRFYQPIVKDL